MPVFSYRARNSDNVRVEGTILADSARQARDQIRERNLVIERFLEQKALLHPTVAPSWQWLQPRYRHQVTTFFRELSTLLAVGVPLVDALDIQVSQLGGRFRSFVLTIRESVASGESLSKSFARAPRVFDSFCISMTEVGENAGSIDSSLSQLARFREDRDQMKDRVVSALMYPSIVALVTFGVTIFLMTVVVPTLLQNLIEMERPLPWPTKVLQFISDGLLQHGLSMATAGLVIGMFVFLWGRSNRGKHLLHRWVLKMPILGKLIQKQNCSRIALFVGTLVQSGLDPLKAFEITAKSISNPLYKSALQETSSAVERGRDFASSFAPHGFLFPPTVVQLFVLGQNSGQLDTMLLRLAQDLDRESAMLAGRIATLVEPVLIVGLGVIVGFVLLATMLPILEAGNVL
jgi:type II secretory pathway component PulF